MNSANLIINFPPPRWGRARVGVKSVKKENIYTSIQVFPPPPNPLPRGKGVVVFGSLRSAKSLLMLFLILISINYAFANPPQGPNLGTPATPEQIAHWDIGIMPDGEGLPEGKGTVSEGKRLYEKLCTSCHDPEGAGGTADQLAGAKMPLTGEYPEQTIGAYWPYATTIFDMIRRSMPMDKPGTLANDEIYAITAYLLYLNNIISENDVMSSETLPKVQMPNRDGFINVYEVEKSGE